MKTIYEEKYNKALESAKRELKSCGTLDCDAAKQIFRIFPELQKSEDELIREELIKFLERQNFIAYESDHDYRKWISWVEKQGESIKIKKGKNYLCTRTHKYAGSEWKEGVKYYSPEDYSLVNQGCTYYCPKYSKEEHNNFFEEVKYDGCLEIDKVEPKFKVGDWVVQENIGVYKIIEICKSWYEVIDSENNHWSIHFDYEYMCHLWTIEDAKDGDVLYFDNLLVHGSGTLIYKADGSNRHMITKYCSVNEFGFEPNSYVVLNDGYIIPSSKEQRELLFSKMKKAGYTWDVEKKELKKIEQKPFDYENANIPQKDFAPKEETEFNIGDWVTRKDNQNFSSGNKFAKITEIDKGKCWFKTRTWIETKNIRHWTINDAKDGDVLACESGWTCIFKTLVNDETFSSYCFMDNTKWFCETGSECHTLKEEFIKAYNGKIYPATKEQRDLLFQKMEEAGYTWDAEKKELKKIEQRSIDNLEPKFKVGDWVIFNNHNESVYQVEKIENYRYFLRHYLGGTMSLHFDSELIRLWTIQDARDGDVLISDESHVIFKEIDGLNIKCYCTYHHLGLNPSLYIDTLQNKTAFYPATKEQRDFLFQKIHDAGYTLDAEKKELIKNM